MIMIDNRNSVAIDIMPTLRKELIIIDDEDNIQDRNGFNQEGINAKKEFVEPKDGQEKQTESSNTTTNKINNNVVVGIFGQNFRTETFPSKCLEACQISEINNNVLDLESHGMIDKKKTNEN